MTAKAEVMGMMNEGRPCSYKNMWVYGLCIQARNIH